MKNFTPGPWFSQGEFIGTLGPNRSMRSREESCANGKLIAAAPELRRVLAELLAKIDDTSPMEFAEYSQDSCEDWAEIAEAKQLLAMIDSHA